MVSDTSNFKAPLHVLVGLHRKQNQYFGHSQLWLVSHLIHCCPCKYDEFHAVETLLESYLKKMKPY